MRAILLALFLLVLALPFVLRLAVRGEQGQHSGDELTLVIITPHNHDILVEFARAFNAWHKQRYGRPVWLDYRSPGGTNDIYRQLKHTYDGLRDPETRQLPPDVDVGIDIVWGGGDYMFEYQLKPERILQPMRLSPGLFETVFPEEALAGVRIVDGTRDKSGRPTPLWAGVCLSAFGIVYNPDLYATLNLPEPRRWQDLTLPQLSGLVALADPTHSGSASVAYLMVVQRAMADAEEAFVAANPALKNADSKKLSAEPAYQAALAAGWKRGMGDLLLIAANARYFTDSATHVPNDVGHGQAAAGMAIDFYGRVFQDAVGPSRCRVVLPRGATAITPDPVGILYGVKGERLQLANRFVEYLLSPEGQRMWIVKAGMPGGPTDRSLRRPPVRRDQYDDRRGWTDDVNPFIEAGGFNQRSEWGKSIRETRLMWSAAWIDSRDSLKEAYAAVLRQPEPRRSALIAKLADLPVTMADVENLRIERKKREADPEGDANQWMARQRIEWGARFREHYGRVRAEAE